eukprot:scaffold38705_cov15-Tisochrysis_lutea.AAC.1
MPLALQVTCSTSAKKDPSGDNNIGGGGPGGVGAGGTASASQGAPPAPVKHSPSPEPSDPAGEICSCPVASAQPANVCHQQAGKLHRLARSTSAGRCDTRVSDENANSSLARPTVVGTILEWPYK